MWRIVLTTIPVIFLAACGSPDEETVKNDERFSGEGGAGGSRIITDNKTGCKYLFTKKSNSGGLSILYKENGEVDCGN